MNPSILESKKLVVAEITDKLKSSASSVVVEYRGLTVAEVTELRRELRKEGIEIKVYKNSYAQRAAADLGYEALNEALTGPNAIAFGSDAVAPSRILAKFAKKHKALVLKGALVEGKVVGVDTVTTLATLPNRDGMISMILGMFQSPVRNFAYALSQVAEKKSA
jgi:large subunit ribosomal protein L10